MSGRDEIQAILRDWRDAQRRLEIATARDAEVIEREVSYYRQIYRRMCAQIDAPAGLQQTREQRALDFSGPSTSSGAG